MGAEVETGCDPKTSQEGKKTWKQFCTDSSNAGRKLVITTDQHAACVAMRDSIMAHGKARRVIETDGPVERAIRWRDDDSGLWVRNLLDKIIKPAQLVVDLKTAADPTPTAFAKSVFNFGYHHQAALYSRGAKEVYGIDCEFLFIVVGSKPPHEVCCYILDREAIELGERENKSALKDIARRIAENDWSSRYADTIETINLPRWAYTQETR